jgi:hypothetical protein
MLTLRARSRAGGTESIILVIALGKGLIDTIIANVVLVIVIRDVAIHGILFVFVLLTLSKGLVVAGVANGILVVALGNVPLLGNSKSPPSLYFLMGHVLAC